MLQTLQLRWRQPRPLKLVRPLTKLLLLLLDTLQMSQPPMVPAPCLRYLLLGRMPELYALLYS